MSYICKGGDSVGVRPKKLADKYNMSANTLRNYEAKGLLPPAERSANGYRLYTERHEAYLACLQAMAPAFGMEATTEVLLCLHRKELDDALWIVREREVLLHREKERLAQLIREWKAYAEGSQPYDGNQRFRIHEVSRQTGVPKSAIRHWEKSGLFSTERDPDNGYRLYKEPHLFKIRMLQVLQGAVYSEETVTLKQSIAQVNIQNFEQAMNVAERIQEYLHTRIGLQMRGIYFLYRLLQDLGLSEASE
ncbi:MerR family DNA-binding transcriptional regulator [Paenibacillus sp. J31TS4]|uniref:MerR family DNA-binding transcriptional regulator n=1 Tax=Paenibacillus sp. J31TS4 TaxID=2807195 RepID=UPI0024BDF0E1|nr:MerR family DNA-binding transcriptional regulator [Paenibacillus sp. J31TS4]